VKLDGNLIMLADCFEGSHPKTHPLIGLFMNYQCVDQARNTYNILSEGGNVLKPFAQNDWGMFEAKLKDKFGICWSISCPVSTDKS
jgi:uncharacterized glyoxalase superfamily protein PhnB